MMVEIHVALADPAHVQGLLGSLAGLFGGASLAYDEGRNEICVSSEWESRDVNQVVGAFESWLAEDGAGSSAKLWIGDTSCEVDASACMAAETAGATGRPAPAVLRCRHSPGVRAYV